MTLRAYQTRNVHEILGMLCRNRSPIYFAPTGAGKTEVFVNVVGEIRASADWDCGIFVYRDPLLKQASERLTRYGIPHGILKPGHELCAGDRVVVASVDTVRARMDRPEYRRWLSRIKLAVFDEAHHAPADMWQQIMGRMAAALFLGPTASPWRMDGKGLRDAGFNAVVRAPGIRELVGMGYLAPFRVVAPPMPPLDRELLKVTAGDYNQAEVQALMDNDQRLLAMVRNYNRLAAGLPAFGFATGINHADRMAAIFRRFGWAAAAVSGETPEADLDKALADLGLNRMQMVASAQKLYEGTDVPAVTAVIDEAPTASTQRFIQRVGRCLRMHQDKTRALIIDTAGNTAVHGMPDAERPWTLEGGVKGLERQVEPTRRCARCWTVHSWADACPECAARYPKSKGKAPVWHLPMIGGMRPEMIASMTVADAARQATTRREMELVAQIKGMDRAWVDRAMTWTGRAAA